LEHVLVKTCSVYLYYLGGVAQNSYRGKQGWMGDLCSQVFEVFAVWCITANKWLWNQHGACHPLFWSLCCCVLLSVLFI